MVFMASNFNYCPIVWHHCGASNSQKLERLQCRALRAVYNDSSCTYEQLLDRSGLISLQVSRLKAFAQEAYKCLNKQAPKYMQDLVKLNDLQYSLRSKNLVNTLKS